jgi:2-polyprenyl-3-methyl-5-hydroxy-6-metoxy-1,4-benzoquinol methylase
MKLEKPNNFTKKFYSCVIDNNPLFYYQGYIFVLSLICLAKVEGNKIFVHLLEKNQEFEDILKKYEVNIRYIERWGDGKWCNKLQQLETKDFWDADYVFLCDSDIAITEDLYPYLAEKTDYFLGKIVDFDNPPIQILSTLFESFSIKYPKICSDTLNSKETFSCNFNGGLLGIPGKHIKELKERWKPIANELIKNKKYSKVLGNYIMHADQISLCMVLSKTEWEYKLLPLEFNCPVHIDINLVKQRLVKKPLVIHYHKEITTTGLLKTTNYILIDNIISEVNKIITSNFSNSLFWNYRYFTNPELGSGLGSRGEYIKYKLKLLKNMGAEKANFLLDVGCGDLEIISKLKIKKYFGMDISENALKIAKEKFPDGFYFNYRDREKIPICDLVVCFDVTIHQETREKYLNLIKFLISKTGNSLIISGYDNNVSDNSNMCFFYENIDVSLRNTGSFKYVFKIGEYRGVGVYFADKGNLNVQNTANDISNYVIDKALSDSNLDRDLLLSSVIVSRNYFGWFTKHYPRIYEYPWLLKKLGHNLRNLNIADFGAGISPIPIQIAQKGAYVFTIDNHSKKLDLTSIVNSNEWGFFDYNIIDKNVRSINEPLNKNTFKGGYIDVWYSISVIEHMSAKSRKEKLDIIAKTLKSGGKIYFTLDLIKGTKKLWNRSEGKIVENESDHGTLDSFIKELEKLNIYILEEKIISMPKDEKVDIALISGEKDFKKNQLFFSNNNIKQEVFCTIGMHRSGTSLTQKILNIIGISLGPEDKLHKPQKHNPKGFWEQSEIVSINDKILNLFDGSWDNPPKFPDNWNKLEIINQLKFDAYNVIENNFKSYKVWGFKDPRTSLTLPFWQEIIPEMKYIICVRNPLDVSLSLKNRDNFSIEKGLTLWTHYTINAILNTANHQAIFMPYENIMSEPETQIDKLLKFFDMLEFKKNEKYEEALKFIDSSLFHHKSSLVDLFLQDKVGVSTLLYENICSYIKGATTYEVLLQTVKCISKILDYSNYLIDKALESERNKIISSPSNCSQFHVLTYNASLKNTTLYRDNLKYCQLFFDISNGFTEENSLKLFVENVTDAQDFIFDLSNIPNIKNIRFDPLNDNCVIEIDKVCILRNNEEIDIKEKISSNAFLKQDKTFYFDNIDPQIYCDIGDKATLDGINKIIFKIKYIFSGKEALHFTLSQYKIQTEVTMQKFKNILKKLNHKS